MEDAQKVITQFLKTVETINKTYAECCDFFMFGKNDEKAKKSEDFFKFFTAFFDTIIKCMPKEERQKKTTDANKGSDKAAPGGAARKYQVGQKVGGMGDVMSELKNKQLGKT